MTITTTQHSALIELARRGRLWPSGEAFGVEGRMFARRTLQALVDAGFAEWKIQHGVMPKIILHDDVCGECFTVNDHTAQCSTGDEDVAEVLVDPCKECQEAEAEEYGMCASCFHDAYRSGWVPVELQGNAPDRVER